MAWSKIGLYPTAPVVLPTTGQYTIVLDPAQRHTGQATIRVRT